MSLGRCRSCSIGPTTLPIVLNQAFAWVDVTSLLATRPWHTLVVCVCVILCLVFRNTRRSLT